MLSGERKENRFWDVQVSIANAAAKLPEPSLAKLQHEVLEEIGQLPGPDLIKYFIGIANIPREEVEEYLTYIGKSKEKLKKRTSKSDFEILADKIAGGKNPSVLKFRQAFITEYNEPPSEQLTKFFLQKVQGGQQKHPIKGDKQVQFDFAKKIAHGKHPTVLTLRKEYTKEFGTPPTDDITGFFLKTIKDAPPPEVDEQSSKDFEAKVNFAKTVSNGLIPTILQFRKAYEKVYGESPSTEIIDVFIKHLPRKGEESRPL